MQKKDLAPILYRPFMFMICVGVLPPVIAVIVLIMYYYNGHNLAINHFPTISESAVKLPESRFFSVGINICAWLLLPVFLILDRILKLQNRRVGNSKAPGVLFARLAMNILDGFSFFSLIGFCSVTLEENRTFHMLCITIFVSSITLSFFCIDYQMAKGKSGNSTFQYIWTFMIPTTYMCSLFIWKFSGSNNRLKSIAAMIEYVAAFIIFFKFILIWLNLPRIGLILTKKVA